MAENLLALKNHFRSVYKASMFGELAKDRENMETLGKLLKKMLSFDITFGVCDESKIDYIYSLSLSPTGNIKHHNGDVRQQISSVR